METAQRDAGCRKGEAQSHDELRTQASRLAVRGAALVTGAAGSATAATQQDGLVNVAVGDVTITDAVDIGVAAHVAAQTCASRWGLSRSWAAQWTVAVTLGRCASPTRAR